MWFVSSFKHIYIYIYTGPVCATFHVHLSLGMVSDLKWACGETEEKPATSQPQPVLCIVTVHGVCRNAGLQLPGDQLL